MDKLKVNRLNDYKCPECDRIIESYGYPKDACSCGKYMWTVVFTTPPSIRTQHASVFPKIDEVNKKIREETMEEEPDPSYEGDKW